MPTRRPLVISCRVTELEMQHAQRQARLAGKTRDAWLHELVRAALIQKLQKQQAP